MRTPCRAAPTSRHFPISEYRQLRGLQERLVRIDEPSHPIPVKANLIMYEQDHARTFSERSNHAAEEKKTLYQAVAEAQLEAWNTGSGYFYWSYKLLTDTINDKGWIGWDSWDLGRCVDFGWFPRV